MSALRTTRQRLASIDAQLASGQAADPTAAAALASRLEPFAPETDAATQRLREQVEPALAAVQQARDAEQPIITSRIERAREVIREANAELGAAHDELATRQPAPAARWFARQASQALLRRDPALHSAAMDQAHAAAALRQAAQQEAWRACRARLATLPAAATYLTPSPLNETAARLERLLERSPSRESSAAARGDDAPSLTPREIDPPEYQDALRAYFQQIQRLRQTPARP
jgi:hypothetical protein